MNQVSRPLVVALLVVVAFLGVWLVALKPSPSGSSSSSGSPSSVPNAPGVTGLKSAVDKAHQAVTTSNAASAAHGGTVATTPAQRAGGRALPVPGGLQPGARHRVAHARPGGSAGPGQHDRRLRRPVRDRAEGRGRVAREALTGCRGGRVLSWPRWT